jgi:hypothetical protein
MPTHTDAQVEGGRAAEVVVQQAMLVLRMLREQNRKMAKVGAPCV